MRPIQVLSALAVRRLLSRLPQPAGFEAAGSPREDLLALPSYHVTRALRQANARAWVAVEVTLAGEELWERAQLQWQRQLDEAFFQPLRAFLNAVAPLGLQGQAPRAVRHALKAATRSGLLINGPLDLGELLRSVELDADLDDDCHDENVLSGLADAVAAAGAPELRPLFLLSYAGREPLLVVLVAALFRHAVEADPDLFGDFAGCLGDELDEAAIDELRAWAAALDHERSRIDALLDEVGGPVAAEPLPIAPVRAESGDAKARFERGLAHVQRGEFENAVAELSAALHLDPALAAAYRQRGDVYRLKGEYPLALADYCHALRLEPENSAVLLARGQVHWLSRQYTEAVADFSAVLEAEPRSAVAHHFRGKAHADAGDLQAAAADFGEAQRCDPATPWLYHDRGDVFAALQDYERAIADYTQALRLNPLAALTFARRGDAYAAKEDLNRAVADYNQALRVDPMSAAVYRKRGAAYRQLGKYDLAAADLSRALELDETNAELYHQRGVLFRQRGDHERAVEDLSAAIRLDAGNAELYYQRGEARAALGDHEQAVADLDAAIRLNPYHARAYNGRGLVHAARGSETLALDDLTAALQIDASFAGAYANRARVLARLGRFEEAVADCDEAVRCDPALVDAFLVRGSALAQQGDYGRATDDFTRALRIQPEEPQAFFLRGLAHFKEGRLPKALADFTAVLRLDREHARAYSQRAKVLQAAQQHERALNDLAHAARLEARYAPDYCRQLGLLHAAQGDYDRAAADYSLALLFEPNDAAARAGRDEAWRNFLSRPRKVRTAADAVKTPGSNGKHAPAAAAATLTGEKAAQTQLGIPVAPDQASDAAAGPEHAERVAAGETGEVEITIADVLAGETPTAENPAATATGATAPGAVESSEAAAPDQAVEAVAYRREQELVRQQEEERARKLAELNRRMEEDKRKHEEEARKKKERTKRKAAVDDDDEDRLPLWKKGMLVAAAVFGLWFAGSWMMQLYADYTARDPVTLASMFKAFDEDTAEARKKYNNGFFQLTGKAKFMKLGKQTVVALEHPDVPNWMVRCQFDMNAKMYKQRIVDKLQVGEEITVEGRCIYRPEEGPKTLVLEECALCEKS